MEWNVINGKVLWNATREKRLQERRSARPTSQSEAWAVRSQVAERVFMTAGAVLAAAFLIGAVVSPLWAQTYPTKAIRLVLPAASGGATDIVGRLIGPMLAERLGQPVVPENRPGAGGNIGHEFVAKARPDGYTIVLVTPSLAISPSLYKKLGYDPIKDLAPISLVAQIEYVLLVHPSLPVKNLKEFVEYARANPGKLNYGSSGPGTLAHLAMELLKSLAKINIVPITYKSVGLALTGMLSGETHTMMSTIASAIPQIEAGKTRALAVLSKNRVSSLPSVPTATEAGVDLLATIWHGLLAPAGTPIDIVNRLNADWVKIAAMPDTREKMGKAGIEPTSSTPEEFADFIKAEVARWGKVIKEAGIPTVD